MLGSGHFAAARSLDEGECALVVLAEDAEEGTVRRFRSLAARGRIPVLRAGSKERLGAAIGQSPRSVIAVTSNDLAEQIRRAGIQSGGIFYDEKRSGL